MFVAFDDLTPEQRAEALAVERSRQDGPLRAARMAHMSDFMYWVCADGSVSRKLGHFKLTPRAEASVDRFTVAPTAASASRGDLSCWKPGVEFHFDRSPDVVARSRPRGVRGPR